MSLHNLWSLGWWGLLWRLWVLFYGSCFLWGAWIHERNRRNR